MGHLIDFKDNFDDKIFLASIITLISNLVFLHWTTQSVLFTPAHTSSQLVSHNILALCSFLSSCACYFSSHTFFPSAYSYFTYLNTRRLSNHSIFIDLFHLWIPPFSLALQISPFDKIQISLIYHCFMYKFCLQN